MNETKDIFISRSEAYKRLKSEAAKYKLPFTVEALDKATYIVDVLPPADVAVIRHGKWEISSDGYYPYCSECKARPEGKLAKYCGECGAKMDKE